MENSEYDIMVIGGGNAALCAAITARLTGAKVLVLEAAPKPYRGGNSRHTRNFRCMHDGPLGVLSDTYGVDEYYEDLLKVTKGQTDEALAKMTIETSAECYRGWRNRAFGFSRHYRVLYRLGVRMRFSLVGGRHW